MASSASGIFVDSCQYTPIYFVESPGITQANSYVVTQNAQDYQKPVSDNLKKFYENSGKLETNLCTVESNSKPRILKKADSNQVGNNLKLASFLLPKPEPNVCGTSMTMQASNVLLKPVYIANTPHIVNNSPQIVNNSPHTVNNSPKLDVQSKIVQLKEMTNITRTPNGKIVPKTKPKENVSKAKHTSVQLLKLGDSYHSLNRLSEEQMKIVNHALKIFNNPKEIPQKPKYDPVTNTKFIYKVVSSKDVSVVGGSNLIFPQNKPDCIVNKSSPLPSHQVPDSHGKNGLSKTNKVTEPVRDLGKLVTQKKIEHLGKNVLLLTQKKQEHIKNGMLPAQKYTDAAIKANDLLLGPEKLELKAKKINLLTKKPENTGIGKSLLNMKTSHVKTVDSKKTEIKRKIEREDTLCEANSNIPIFLENAVTRSGRKVRISRYILQDTLDKPKKKVSYVASCPQCSLKFTSTYKLQRHYEFNPTHSPERVHTNLFQCFLSIVKGSKDNGANVFLDQLEQFMTKLRSCIPCLVEADDCTNQSSFINDDISRLLGITSGRYKIRTTGLDCGKDENGQCPHNSCPECPEQQRNEAAIWNEPSQGNTETNTGKIPGIKIEIRKCNTEENFNAKKVKPNPAEIRRCNTEENFNAKKVKLNPIDIRDGNTEENSNTKEVKQNQTEIIKNNTEEDYNAKQVQLNQLEIKTSNTEDVKKVNLNLNSPNVSPGMSTDDIVALLSDSVETNSVKETNAIIDKQHEVVTNPHKTYDNLKANHIQFRSTHFDIRSSPIKTSMSTFSKFQINTENMSKYKVHILQPLELNQICNNVENPTSLPKQLFNENIGNDLDNTEQNSEIISNWPSEKTYVENSSNSLIGRLLDETNVIKPALIHTNDIPGPSQAYENSEIIIPDQILSEQDNAMDALNFLESLGNECIYPETEIRHNAIHDFHLDLF